MWFGTELDLHNAELHHENAGLQVHTQTAKASIFKSNCCTPGPKGIKLFSCSPQLSMTFFMLINLKLLTNANSFLLNLAELENFSANNY